MLGSASLVTKFVDRFAREWTSADKVASRALALSAAVVFAVVASFVFGFTVDDALITARYAANLNAGEGYRFNSGGPASDGVTPLGYAHVLAPFAVSTQAALTAAKWIGLSSTALAVFLAARVSQQDLGIRARWLSALPLVVLSVSPQLAAWAVSGMETGLVTLLVTVGVFARSRREGTALTERFGVLALGLAAALRPELFPAMVVLAVAPPLGRPSGAGPAAVDDNPNARAIRAVVGGVGRAAFVLLPLACVTLARLIIFGAATPLSVMAKRPDLERGLEYAAASVILIGAVQLVSLALLRDARGRWLVSAVVVHVAAVALAGGDWMALSRLFVPMLPVLALAAQRAAAQAPWPLTLLRSGLAFVCALFAWNAVGWNVGRVGGDREVLVAAMRAPLASAKIIAAVDIGWPALAAPHANIVDLAGVTDAEIARLPGPHTQKRIPEGLLDARSVDALVFNVPCGTPLAEDWTKTPFIHAVERRLASEHGARDVFEPTYEHRSRPCYVVLTRREGASRPAKPANAGF